MMPAAAGPEPHDQGVPLDWTNVYLSVAFGLSVASVAECNARHAAVTATQIRCRSSRGFRRCPRDHRDPRDPRGKVFCGATI